MTDRPEGRPRQGDLHRGHRDPAGPQVPVPHAGRFKALIAAEPDTGLITDDALTKAAGAGTGDAAGAVVLAGDDSLTEPGQVAGRFRVRHR